MKILALIMILFLLPISANEAFYNYSEEELISLKEKAMNEARNVMMREILNVTKDVSVSSSFREELIENLCSTAPMNNFTVNADISDSLVQNAGDFSGSIFVSRDFKSNNIVSISFTFGRLLKCIFLSESRVAASIGNEAFFEPEILTCPLSIFAPKTSNFSIIIF